MGNPLLFIPFRPPRFSACSPHDHDSHPPSRPIKPIVLLLIFYSVISASTPFIASCNLAVVPSYANVLQVSVCKIVLTNRPMVINLEFLLTCFVFNKEHCSKIKRPYTRKNVQSAYPHYAFSTKKIITLFIYVCMYINLFRKIILCVCVFLLYSDYIIIFNIDALLVLHFYII